ncbi:hypothetical protein BAUCODRAFT_23582 [Baudoinia panamericana UAMH 10762]|uniref:Uncharacterized protein n=1 Tax=Baudoinia panamericana (strain UAMH 10762) TaxID=717646 RepID=M2LRX2_BAUPA|nr:uncharacterized protein BAUCODRAFT_23582 [Baudoinia panamericana UAMH 10762]EMC97232.1 hypothetical protein BAUCODRAFT_23582 [Baudoinia panamericana UAMH 10762]
MSPIVTYNSLTACVSEIELCSVNFPLDRYRYDAYDFLPSFEDGLRRIGKRDTILSAFDSVKPVFAEYNKWDDYGIALLYKDFDMLPDERLIECGGTSVPWRGQLPPRLEQRLVPRCIRFWEGTTLPYTFTFRNEKTEPARDLIFEREALSRLGGLGLVRLDRHASREWRGDVETEYVNGRATVTLSTGLTGLVAEDKKVVPIAWEFRRQQEGASERYRIKVTRYRLRPEEDAYDARQLLSEDTASSGSCYTGADLSAIGDPANSTCLHQDLIMPGSAYVPPTSMMIDLDGPPSGCGSTHAEAVGAPDQTNGLRGIAAALW